MRAGDGGCTRCCGGRGGLCVVRRAPTLEKANALRSATGVRPASAVRRRASHAQSPSATEGGRAFPFPRRGVGGDERNAGTDAGAARGVADDPAPWVACIAAAYACIADGVEDAATRKAGVTGWGTGVCCGDGGVEFAV